VDELRKKNGVLLSVILPNYNHGHLLQRAFEAIRAQELQPDEIFLIDDGSTDDSSAVIDRLAATMPALRVIKNPQNAGLVPAQQRGLAAARGRYVYFAAADDWVMPGFFAFAIGMLEKFPQAALFTGETNIVDGPTGRFLGMRPIVRPVYRSGMVDQQQVLRLLTRSDNWVLTGSTVFRRDVLLAAGGFDERLGSYADGYLVRKVILTHGFCFAPQTVATWCVFPDSASRSTALDEDSAVRILTAVPSHLAADPVFPKEYLDLFRNRWRFATSRLSLEARPINHAQVIAMGARTPADRAVLECIWRISKGQLGRLATLAWLWFRLRPYRLVDLVRTSLSRALERLIRVREP